MIARLDRYCDRTLLLLLRTFLDIIALRKGPEHVPHSWLLLLLCSLSMLFAAWCAVLLIEAPEERNYGLNLAINSLGIGYYGAILFVTGNSRRMLQTLTTIIGCGAILTMLVFLEMVLLRPLLGVDFARLIGLLIIFWSVPVEGHIIARAIDRHWFIGIAIAIAAFALQFAFQLRATDMT